MERTPDTGNTSSWENLSYVGARYYHPQTGRFISVDPGHVGGRLEDPQSWNGYAYARNNPLIYVDPTGMMYEVCVFAGSCFETSDDSFARLRRDPGAGIYFHDDAFLNPGDLVSGWIWEWRHNRWGSIGFYRQTSKDLRREDTVPLAGLLADRWLKERGTEMAAGAAVAATGGLVGGALSGGLVAEGVSVTARLAPLKYGKQGGQLARQMAARAWTDDMIREALASGQKFHTFNKANCNPAIRYVHSRTGQSVVVDTVTKEIIHVGGRGFLY